MRRKYEPFKGQKFDKLHKHCRELDTLFNDSVFPASASSLGDAADFPDNVEWKRPSSLVTLPRLLPVDGEPVSVLPGQHSSLQMTAACAALAVRKDLLAQVVPGGQSFPAAGQEVNGDYAGVFHFRVWRFGHWLDVVVDDLLPCAGGVPLFSRSANTSDMWLSLLEKAYAKVLGSYSALAHVSLRDALVDLTGGVSEAVSLRTAASASADPALPALARRLLTERSSGSLMACALPTQEGEGSRAASGGSTRSDTGLLPGRHYLVVDVKKVHLGEPSLRTLFRGRERVTMVRLRDPLTPPPPGADGGGGGKAGGGEFAVSTARLTQLLSRSSGWAQVAASDRHKLGLALDDDAELWMPLEDFACSFGELTAIRSAGVRGEQAAGSWRASPVAGSIRDRAGGHQDTLLSNPQFLMDVQGDESEVTLQLLQLDSEPPDSASESGLPSRLIGLTAFKVELNREFRLHVLRDWSTAAASVPAQRRREAGFRGPMARGRYIIVPFTGHAGQSGEFLLRAFASEKLKLRAVEKDMPAPRWCGCLSAHAQCFTVVHVQSAQGLPKVNHFGSCDPYCEVRCEGSIVRTPFARNTREPVWDATFVFLRSHPERPLEIRVWSHNALLRDIALGRAELPAPGPAPSQRLRLPLSGVDDSDVGAVTLDLLTDDHLAAV